MTDDGLRPRRTRTLGCYLLPGRSPDPTGALDEARAAEAAGLSAVWIAEKYDVKDLPALAGAISQITDSVRIGAAVTHLGMRHPMALASMGQTLQALTGGRFRLGFGRATPAKWTDYGVAVPRLRSFEDAAAMLRQLWAGETVAYDGPLGRFPKLRLETIADVTRPDLLLAGVGPRMLELAGTAFDGVILHPFLTPEAVARSAAAARRAHEAVGGDPGAFTVVAAVVAAPGATRAQESELVDRRARRYFRSPGLGEALAAANGWDPAPLSALRDRSARIPADAPGGASGGGPRPGLPREWLESSAALGDDAACGRRLDEYVAAGADEIILHGSTAPALAGLADALSVRA